MKIENTQILIHLGAIEVPCKIHFRSSGRNFYFKLRNSGGLTLSVPRSTNSYELNEIIEKHKNWILKTLAKRKMKEGCYYFLGAEINILTSEKVKNKVQFSENNLLIDSSYSEKKRIEDIYTEWLKQEGEKFLTTRLKEIAQLTGLKYESIKIKKLKSSWGLCRRKKDIVLSSRLMKLDKNLIDYIIIHELCHTIEANHSAKFWLLVGKYVPDYKILEKEMNYY